MLLYVRKLLEVLECAYIHAHALENILKGQNVHTYARMCCKTSRSARMCIHTRSCVRKLLEGLERAYIRVYEHRKIIHTRSDIHSKSVLIATRYLHFGNSYAMFVIPQDKWKTLVHTARISPQQRRGEPVPQELLDRVLAAHAYWSQQQCKHQLKSM